MNKYKKQYETDKNEMNPLLFNLHGKISSENIAKLEKYIGEQSETPTQETLKVNKCIIETLKQLNHVQCQKIIDDYIKLLILLFDYRTETPDNNQELLSTIKSIYEKAKETLDKEDKNDKIKNIREELAAAETLKHLTEPLDTFILNNKEYDTLMNQLFNRRMTNNLNSSYIKKMNKTEKQMGKENKRAKKIYKEKRDVDIDCYEQRIIDKHTTEGS